MRAATLVAPGKMEVRSAPIPVPGLGEVLLRIEGCGVCASNLEPWAGNDWTTYPGEPGGLGHEGWGLVDAIGPEVDTDLRPGDRVVSLATRSFAEFDTAPASAVVKLPEAAGTSGPFPGEPLGCAFNVFRRAGIEAGQTVAIVGIGFLGAVLTKLAADAGARVIAVSRRRSSLDLARAWGAAETVEMDDHWQIIEQVKQLTADRLCERVIECVGHQWPLDLAGDLVGFGGRLVIAGYHQDGPRQVNMQMWNWKGIDVANAHERDPAVQVRGLREAVDAVARGVIDLAPLCTDSFSLDRLDEALAATRDKPEGFVKAVVRLA